MPMNRNIYALILVLAGMVVPNMAKADSLSGDIPGGDAVYAEMKMTVSTEMSAVDIRTDGRNVRVTGAAGQKLEIFNVTGRKMAEYVIDASDKTISLSLSRGWYIFRVGNMARKAYVS